MKKSNYFEKLKDPRWQKKRLQLLESAGWKCQKCKDEKQTLHVHHKKYILNHDPWDYPDKYLIVLCESCHANEENEKFVVNDIIERFLLTGGDYSELFLILRIYIEENNIHPRLFPELYKDGVFTR